MERNRKKTDFDEIIEEFASVVDLSFRIITCRFLLAIVSRT